MSKTATVRKHRKGPPHEGEISPANRELLGIIEEWKRQPLPPEYDDAFWKDFNRDLKKNRIILRRPL
jgi:hypothetical protein